MAMHQQGEVRKRCGAENWFEQYEGFWAHNECDGNGCCSDDGNGGVAGGGDGNGYVHACGGDVDNTANSVSGRGVVRVDGWLLGKERALR